VRYDEQTTHEQIADFSYRFKRASANPKEKGDALNLLETSNIILPANSNAELFFTAGTNFKQECILFHSLHIDDDFSEERNSRLLRRNNGFPRHFYRNVGRNC
jgi:hypothetical protein